MKVLRAEKQGATPGHTRVYPSRRPANQAHSTAHARAGPELGAGEQTEPRGGLRAEGHATHFGEGGREVKEGSQQEGSRWEPVLGGRGCKGGAGPGLWTRAGAPIPFSCLSIVRWGRPGRRREYERLMGLGPQRRSCPWAGDGMCRSRGCSGPSGHTPSCQGTACPLRAARTAGSPQAWARGSHPTPLSRCPSPSRLP